MMDRTDRIALIVATVLVVVLAAGAGFLVWKRSDVLAGERPVTADATATLSPMEATEAAAPPTAYMQPATPAKRSLPPKGAELGYAKTVRKSGGVYSLSYDPAAFLTGSEAELSAKKHGLPGASGGRYIANDKHTLKRVPFAPNAAIVQYTGTASGQTDTLTPAEFYKGVSDGDDALTKAPWWIYVSGGKIVKMEQYTP